MPELRPAFNPLNKKKACISRLFFGSSRLTGKCISDLEKEVGAIPVTVCHAFDDLYLVVHSLQATGM